MSLLMPELDIEWDSSERALAVQALVENGIRHVDSWYGAQGRTPLPRHNTEHTIGVVMDSIAIGTAERIPVRHLGNLVIAAAFHDSVFDLVAVPRANEYNSAELANECMRHYDIFKGKDRDEVRHMIEDTFTVMMDGGLVQNPSNFLGKVLCDADLANIGKPTPIYDNDVRNLWTERVGAPATSDEDVIAMYRQQIPVLEKHKFHTDGARQLLPNRPKNLEYTLAIVMDRPAA